MIERMKKRSYKNIHGYSYFWRTYGQKEIDLIEERGGKIFPYEFKWSPKNKVLSPKEWVTAYPKAEKMLTVNSDNYLDFIS